MATPKQEQDMIRKLEGMGFDAYVATDWGHADTYGKRVILGTISPPPEEEHPDLESFIEFSAPQNGYSDVRVHDDDPDYFDIALIPDDSV